MVALRILPQELVLNQAVQLEVPAGARGGRTEEGRKKGGREEGRRGRGRTEEQGGSRVKNATALPIPWAVYSATIF